MKRNTGNIAGIAGNPGAPPRENASHGVRWGEQAFGPLFNESPSEENINSLMGLGFDRDTVVQALERTGNNLEQAANRLLGGN